MKVRRPLKYVLIVAGLATGWAAAGLPSFSDAIQRETEPGDDMRFRGKGTGRNCHHSRRAAIGGYLFAWHLFVPKVNVPSRDAAKNGSHVLSPMRNGEGHGLGVISEQDPQASTGRREIRRSTFVSSYLRV